jgi:hypothetical protein
VKPSEPSLGTLLLVVEVEVVEEGAAMRFSSSLFLAHAATTRARASRASKDRRNDIRRG